MPRSPGRSHSPLAPLTQNPAWQEHCVFYEKAFGKLNAGHNGIIQAAKDKNVYTSGRSFGRSINSTATVGTSGMVRIG